MCDVAHDETPELVEDVVIEPVAEVIEESDPVELYEETSGKSDLEIAREENEMARRFLELAKDEFGPIDIRISKQ